MQPNTINSEVFTQETRGIYFFVSSDPQQENCSRLFQELGWVLPLVCWRSLCKALHGSLSLFHPCQVVKMIMVCVVKVISALAFYSDVGLYYLVQKCQLIPAVTALLCRQPNYKNLLEGKSNGICWKTRFHSRHVHQQQVKLKFNYNKNVWHQ